MEARHLVAVFVKAAAIFVFLKVTVEAFYLWASFSAIDPHSGDLNYLIGSAIYFSIFGVVAVVMWFFPLKVSERLLPKSVVSKEINASVPYKSLLSLSLVIIGFCVLSSSLPDLVHNVVYIKSMNNMAYGSALSDPNTAAMLAGTIAEIVLGLVLVVGSVGISAAVKRLRAFPSQ